MFLCLTGEANYLDQNHLFFDGAFTMHTNTKSHTGAYMIFGKEIVNRSAKTQHINTTSLTEVKVVALYKSMPAIMWTRYFLEGQGCPLKPTTLHQDNTSAMLLELNGRASSSRRTRHMNIRYFFVGDMAKRQHITIHYCPTDEQNSAASATLS